MTQFGTAAAWILGLVLLAASVAKLTSRKSTARALNDIGLPLPEKLAIAVPVAEIGVATLLVTLPVIGATAAVSLLAAFTAFLMVLVREGRAVPCSCFGSSGHRPVDPTDIVRNAGLMTLALVALFADRSLPRPLETTLICAGLAIGTLAIRQFRPSRQPRSYGRSDPARSQDGGTG